MSTDFIPYEYLIAIFLYSSVTDMEKREIPLWAFPSALAVFLMCRGTDQIVLRLISAAIFFVPTLILGMLGKMGGGDIIMFTISAYIIGLENCIPFSIMLFITGLVLAAISKFKNRELPMAPIATIAYMATLRITPMLR